MDNDFYLCQDHEPEPIPWDPYGPPQDRTVHEVYFGRVLQKMESHLQRDGLTFYLTWDVDRLPSYGSDVVAVVMGDEWARFPRYASQIRTTFKCYGTRLPLGGRPFHQPSYLNTLSALKYARTQMYRLPYTVAELYDRLRSLVDDADRAPVYPIPLGYANQIDLPVKDITTRRYDVQFAGSVTHGSHQGLRKWLRPPKSVSREQMLTHLEAYAETHPDLTADVFITSGFGPHAAIWGSDQFETMRDAEEYSRTLMDTKICLAPRGSSLETFRYFEALRAGCVLITEALPSRWFYDEAPTFQLDDWSELGSVLDRLLHDDALLQEYHEKSLAWWRQVCSEDAVGRYLAERIHDPHAPVAPDRLPDTAERAASAV